MNQQLKDQLSKIGIRIPNILLPREGITLNNWAVVACDQYTSEPDYWKKVEELVGEAPSTLKITLPEVYLESDDKTDRIVKINSEMKNYLDSGILEDKGEMMVLVERSFEGKKRMGLVLALDLEKYDYKKGSKTLIRATEGTVESRIPPRLEIRREALIELPHIMVLVDDPERTLINEGLGQAKPLLYNFDLMMDGGHVRGWKIDDEKTIEKIAEGLEKLISSDGFLFAMGDGNHSLATAKAFWEQIKTTLSEEEKEGHPARFALVEIVNVHDSGLEFEPIHRLVYEKSKNLNSKNLIEYISGDGDEIEMITSDGKINIKIKNRGSSLPVGNLQILIDEYLTENPEVKVDYIHGEESLRKVVAETNGLGFLLSVMKKEELFPTVEKDGALPRKTFSMGEANEKRYYLEARRIQ